MEMKEMYMHATSRRWLVRILALATISVSIPSLAAPEKPLPTNSVYQLSIPLVDQNGRASQLADWRGQTVMISMFYTSCEFVCPRIVEALKRTEEKLSAGGGGRVPVLMVTFDPSRDDVAVLKHTVEERHLDEKVWTLARTDARNVRKLAALLGIQYRALPSGEFNHSSVLILLDAEGRIVGRTSTIGEADPAFVKMAEKTLRNGKAK